MRLIEEIVSKDNLNQAFLQVTGNKGASGIDNMTCDEVKDYLKVHGQDLINRILSREYQPLPVRRVEIPKPNGGVRKLGIPTVVDRIVQQAIVQKLTPIFEPTFSEYSYGFRPGRRCQDAIDRTLELINQGYEWVVDLDLEKFFDNVPQDKLIRIVDNVAKDSDVTALIHKFLIYLNELDRELERRQLHFARYADDCVIFVKTEFSAERVMKNIVTFIETKLKLKVNAAKTHITRPNNLKYLGFSFWKSADGWKAKPHDESFMKLFRKLKKLMRRSWSVDNDYRIEKINQVLRGWINYYSKSSMKAKIKKLGEWLRNAMRVVIWKQWKVSQKKIEALVRLKIDREEAKGLTYCRRGYQFISHSCVVQRAISNSRLKKRGLLDPLEYYLKEVA